MALKIMHKSEVIRHRQVVNVIAETRILSRIKHPFIVNLLTKFQDERRLFILLEFVNGGELYSRIRRKGRLPEHDTQFYSAEIALALVYLHSLKVLYRDMKPENILIDGRGHIKMTDFGFAKVVQDRTWTMCGTAEYIAPEMLKSSGYFHAVDWWALGILCYEMLAGFAPFHDEVTFGTFEKILRGRLEYPAHFSRRACSFIKALLCLDPTKRLGFSASMITPGEDVKMHMWFKGINWEDMMNKQCCPPYIPNLKSLDDTSMYDRYPESSQETAAAIDDRYHEIFAAFSTID